MHRFKFIYLTLISVLFYLNSVSQIRQKIDIIKEAEHKYKLNTLNYKIFRFDIYEGVLDHDSSQYFNFIINQSDRTITEIQFLPEYYKILYQFNEDKRLIRQKVFNEKEEQTSLINYEYDKLNRLMIVDYYFGDSHAFSEKYHYQNSELISVEYLDDNGNVNGKSFIETDKWGNILSEKRTDALGNTELLYNFVYDADNKCLEEKFFLGEITLGQIKMYNYNSEGDLTETSYYGADNAFVKKEIFEYENGKLKEFARYDQKDIPVLLKSYFYSDNETLIECQVKDYSENTEYILRYFYRNN